MMLIQWSHHVHVVAAKVMATPSLLILPHMVHYGPSLVELSQLPVVVKDAFGGCRLSNVDMGHATNFPVHFKVDFCLFVRRLILLVRHLGLAFFCG